MLSLIHQKAHKNKNLTFLKVALKDIKTTGSVTSSSKYLIRKMLEPINFRDVKNIVEFGAGEGCITQELVKQAHLGTKILSFELNETLYDHLQSIKDRKISFINDNVTELKKYADSNTIDVIVSGLPLANIPKQIKEKIINAALDALHSDGIFIQYQYSLFDYRLLKKHFKQVKLDFTPLNIPPAFIYICKK